MVVLFYFFGILAIISTICVILNRHPVYALLFLIMSFLAISCIFFIVGAPIAGAVEVIIYAGAIMILFIFSVMMLNTNNIIFSIKNTGKNNFIKLSWCCGIIILNSILCAIVLYVCFKIPNSFISIQNQAVGIKQVGIALFGPYIFIVELASFLLLGALISVFYLAQEHKLSNNYSVSSKSKENRI
ncbi:NADH-quinone oxidoreductase subunit J [Candidatus Blochmannia ocreatus (nom. nud.)]|uniref:NADH-quinone oxidoreductase subunit J n=1 Tax=Candidatus Blochmannia ocreatus (nom. nud.) TaxID=251538 RepID=A0ABY4SSM3_9ENTR|nr:NADH-quinone oxidoreductase subunit J [Candidatus Blochmannia ocreatus]URJ24977.1 NADH-quinone oxidoreductase subunit J [Candidatus Blochmannia ocreatus]